MYRNFFTRVKNIIPKISSTELIALRSGSVSLDGQIFQGEVNLPGPPKKITMDEYAFIPKVDKILNQYKDSVVFPGPDTDKILDAIGQAKLLGFIVPKSYGGSEISTTSMSNILTRITSANPALGIMTMVPNSLGPGELLTHYGTQEQKDKYLPGLVTAKYIPCFGLTGPNNGSDATGSIDKGIIFKDPSDQSIKIKIKFNKRYITLAPVANLIGLAFHLEDPDGLLINEAQAQSGVTLALIESSHPGLIRNTYHNPLNAGFPNGTLKGEIVISADHIIGGLSQAGNGWKMLMECLAAGRAVSLPATANAASKVATYGTFLYASHRHQFKRKLIQMEGIQEKMIEMMYQTWVIQSSIAMTNTLLDDGEKPAVISAIMKQQTTDRARIVINHGMDINAGSSICLGPNNFMDKFYQSSPIGITVEGSNVLTRNLIIFGQGLNKSHPNINQILDSVLNDDLDGFKSSFNAMIRHVLGSYGKCLKHQIVSNSLLEKQTYEFANLANFVALLGGAIKEKQFISGKMADILSNLYLAYSIEWYGLHHSIPKYWTDYCIQRLCDENKAHFNLVIDNYSFTLLKPLLCLQRYRIPSEDLEHKKMVFNQLIYDQLIISNIKENIYVSEIIEKLEDLHQLDPTTEEYQRLYDQVIQVGEYNI